MNRMRLLITMFWLTAATLPAAAQNLYGGNPADADMLESGFSNPALNVLVKDRITLALTSHQNGVAGKFLAVRSGFITYNFPWIVRGLSVGAQFLQAGLYSQNEIRAAYGRRLLRDFAVGASVDLFNRSFDKTRFSTDFNRDDPVFRNGTSKFGLSLGVGLLAKVHRNLTLGLCIENVNKPNVAMGPTAFNYPMMLSLGLKWTGRRVSGWSTVQPVRMDGFSGSEVGTTASRTPQATQFGMEVPFERASVRAAMDASAATVEVEAPIVRSFYFNYRYAYPLSSINVASSGTHRFGFFADLDRMPVLPAYPMLPIVPPFHTEVSPLDANPRGFVLVYADTDSLSKMQLRVHRNVEDGIQLQNLALLFPEDLGDLKASLQPTRLKEINLLDVRDPTLHLQGLYSMRYLGAVEGIGLLLKDLKFPPATEFLAFAGAERRAIALCNLVTGDHKAVKSNVPLYAADKQPLSPEQLASVIGVADETQELLYPDRIVFHIVPVFRSFEGARWWLEVRDSKEICVYSRSEAGTPPDSLSWNWRDSQGRIIAPGVYTYMIRTENQRKVTDFSHRRGFKVTYQHRAVAIEVTRTPRPADFQGEKYIFVVGAHKSSRTGPLE
ncbi:MAG: type IX secretion system membrane protein PorP/SprF [bacterium]|nr:type IX secretion system membrane protein PorP/SprF [bacterium]